MGLGTSTTALVVLRDIFEGVAVAVADRLDPMVTEITQARITHNLSNFSLVSVYAPTWVNELSVKEAFYTQFQIVVDSCPENGILIVLGNHW